MTTTTTMTTPPATTTRTKTTTTTKMTIDRMIKIATGETRNYLLFDPKETLKSSVYSKFDPEYSTACFLSVCTLYIIAMLLPVLLPAACIIMRYFEMNQLADLAFSLVIGLILMDFIIPIQDGHRPDPTIQSAALRCFHEGARNYFPAKSIFHATKLHPSKSYILASWPHGLLGGVGHFCFVDFMNRGYYPIISAASVLKYIPFLRRVFALIGGTDVSKKSLLRILDTKTYGPTYPNNIAFLLVGGIGEMFYTPFNSETTKNQPEQIILHRRKGFIKLAIESGADIIPHYTFGANQMYCRSFGPNSIAAKFSSAAQVSLLVWFGRWWMPMGVIPFRVPVLSVTGEVYEVPKVQSCDEITDELVLKVHDDFCRVMKKLFDDHKRIYVEEMGAPEEWLTKELKFENE